MWSISVTDQVQVSPLPPLSFAWWVCVPACSCFWLLPFTVVPPGTEEGPDALKGADPLLPPTLTLLPCGTAAAGGRLALINTDCKSRTRMTTSLRLMEVPGWRAPKYGSSFIACSALSLTLRLLSWTQYSTTAGPPKIAFSQNWKGSTL